MEIITIYNSKNQPLTVSQVKDDVYALVTKDEESGEYKPTGVEINLATAFQCGAYRKEPFQRKGKGGENK